MDRAKMNRRLFDARIVSGNDDCICAGCKRAARNMQNHRLAGNRLQRLAR